MASAKPKFAADPPNANALVDRDFFENSNPAGAGTRLTVAQSVLPSHEMNAAAQSVPIAERRLLLLVEDRSDSGSAVVVRHNLETNVQTAITHLPQLQIRSTFAFQGKE